MRHCIYLILIFHLGVVFSQSNDSLKDSVYPATGLDAYKFVVIGNQTCMTENLSVTSFRNGDPIPEAKSVEEWKKAGESKQPVWCYYKNREKLGLKYGKLYNWYAVTDPRGITPIGWHVPTDAEWTILSLFIGEKDQTGTKLKSKEIWSKNGRGTNEFGFSGLPSGYRYFNGYFYGIGNYGFWWSATEKDTQTAFSRFLYQSYINLGSYNTIKAEGLSIRCVKD